MLSVAQNIIKIKVAIFTMALIVFAMANSQALQATQTLEAAQPIEENQRFADAAWDLELLELLSYGPGVLSPDFDTGIDAPHADNSAETQKELQSLIDLKAKRTTDVLNIIQSEHVEREILQLFDTAGLISLAEKVQTKTFFDVTTQDLSYLILRDKKIFSRVRPSVLNADIQPVVENPAHPAYPSGHAAQSYFVGYVLSKLDPAKAKTYQQFSFDVAHRREIAGVHYPSDSVAGFTLAKNVFNGLMENAEIQALYKEAEKEFQVN